jgi:hypothetical protein
MAAARGSEPAARATMRAAMRADEADQRPVAVPDLRRDGDPAERHVFRVQVVEVRKRIMVLEPDPLLVPAISPSSNKLPGRPVR